MPLLFQTGSLILSFFPSYAFIRNPILSYNSTHTSYHMHLSTKYFRFPTLTFIWHSQSKYCHAPLIEVVPNHRITIHSIVSTVPTQH